MLFSLGKNSLALFFQFYFNLFSQRPLLSFPLKFQFCLFTSKRKKRKGKRSPLTLSLMTFIFPSLSSLYLGQMAVSHTTACGLWQGGVPVLRGSGVLLQLGKIGILSCLHKLLSGRRWALISLHRQRFLSITSRSLPSRWAGAAEVPAVPAPMGAWACAASWASCWNWSWICCWCWYCCCRLSDGLQGAWDWTCEREWNYRWYRWLRGERERKMEEMTLVCIDQRYKDTKVWLVSMCSQPLLGRRHNYTIWLPKVRGALRVISPISVLFINYYIIY